MSGFWTEDGVTRCAECRQTLASAEEWSMHRRNHTIQQLVSTSEGRRIYNDLIHAGFKDRLSDWRLKA